MIIERTEKEILIKIPASVDTEDLQDLVDYIRYKELTSGIRVNQDTIDKLANELNAGWWERNKHRWIK